MNNDIFIKKSEKKFKEYAGLSEDISAFPIDKNIANIETNKAKSKEFGEVFTPLYLVDEMIAMANITSPDIKTIDLCSGLGQFSSRLMRYLYNNVDGFVALQDPKNGPSFIWTNHAFAEIQLSSCYKLIETFSKNITLFIGDATHLDKLPANAAGMWAYIESFGYWVCLTQTIKKIYQPIANGKVVAEAEFVNQVGKVISYFNNAYNEVRDELNNLAVDMKKLNNVDPKKIIESAEGRMYLLDQVTGADKGMQKVGTPRYLCDEMIEKINLKEVQNILVLFNYEFIEQLVKKYKIDPSKITFGTDFGSSLKSEAVKKIYGVNVKVFSGDCNTIAGAFCGKKFDVCFSNPPYNRGADLKILQSLLKARLAKEYVIVHPSTWMLDQKGVCDLFNKTKDTISGSLKSIKLFNGNAVFDAELFVPCMITHIDINYNNNIINISYYNEQYFVDNIYDITKFSIYWKPIVKPFMKKVSEFVNRHGNVWDHCTRSIENNKSYCQSAAIRGDVEDRNKKKNYDHTNNKIVKDNFYTILTTVEGCKGIREPRLNKPGGKTPTFGFNSDRERDNFLNYLNTDFARFCLSIFKINQHLENGEMELIPWLDFTEEWTDEKLFAKFDIDQKTQEYIRSFLPDYYGIRN